MLEPVQKLLRLPAADTKGGTFGALPHCGACTAGKLRTSPGATSGAQKQGVAHGKEGERKQGLIDGRGGGQQGGLGGDNIDTTLCNVSSTSGAPSTGDDESSMEGAYGTSGVAEDHRDWKKITRRRGQKGGKKARALRQGGSRRKAGNKDSANEE